MTSATYLATVNSINSALITAGITTLVFTHKTAFTVNAILYANLIDYLGYILESDTLKVNSIITAEFAKLGEWSDIKSPARVITPPSPPVDDHFVILNGYYISNTDLSPGAIKEKQLNINIETATKALSVTIQNKAKLAGYITVVSESSIFTNIEAPVGTRTITSTVTVVVKNT